MHTLDLGLAGAEDGEVNLAQAAQQAAILLEHLDEMGEDLQQGVVVVIGDDRIRVRNRFDTDSEGREWSGGICAAQR